MNETNMMHGMRYSGENLAGWLANQKFDGVRAYWDGSTLWTRGGIAIDIPPAWRDSLPAGFHLDGEIYDGIDGQRRCVNAARYGRFTESMTFKAFDAPNVVGCYVTRLESIPQNAIVHGPATMCLDSTDDALRYLRYVQSQGGEGIMVRHPRLNYIPGRTHLMLKVK